MIADSTVRSLSMAAVVAFLIANAALAWAFPYVPSQDGPSHLITSAIFFDLMQPHGGLNEAFYNIRPHFYTNYGVEAISYPFLSWLGPIIVEKIIFTTLIVGLPLSIIACMLAAGGRVFPLALFAIPYGYTTTLAYGNYNFLIGETLGLLILSNFLKTALPPSNVKFALLTAGWVIISLVHPAAAIVFMFFSGIAMLGRLFTENPRSRALLVQSMLRNGLSVVPALVLLFAFIGSSPPGDIEYKHNLYLRLREIIIQWELYKVDRIEIIFCMVLSLSLLAMTIVAIISRMSRQSTLFSKDDYLIIVVFGATFLYIVAPDRMSGGDSFVPRLELFPYIFILVWGSCQRFSRRWLAGFMISGFVINAGFILTAYRVHGIATNDMQSYFRLASAIPEGSIVLPITGDATVVPPPGTQVSMKSAPFQHLYNDIAIERHSVFLQNWNAHFKVANVTYKSERDPYPKLWQGDLARGILEYEKETGVLVQYILLWRVDRDLETEQLLSVLKERYAPVLTQPGRLLTGLYRRLE